MGAETLSTYNAALKEYYGYDTMAMMLLESDPLLAMLRKRKGGGDGIPIPIQYADAAAFSNTLSTAQTNSSTGGKAQFLLVPHSFPDYYAVGKIARKLVLGASTTVESFLDSATNKVDNAFRVMRRKMARDLYGNGSSSIGRIAASGGISSAVITLEDPEDSVNFQKGMVLELSDTESGGSIKSGTVTVSAVNRKDGTITCTGNVTAGIGTAANSDYIYIEDTYDVAIKGLSAWLPSSAPSATTFFGVDRTADSVMLGGNRFNASNMLLYEALLDAASETQQYGDGAITHAFVHTSKFNRLVKEMEAKSRNFRDITRNVPVAKDSKATVGFTGVQIVSAAGTFEVYHSRFIGVTDAFLLNLDSWTLWHVGDEFVDIEGRDSDRGMLVDGSNDAYEARVISYPELACDAPGHNCHIYNFGA